MDRQVEMMFPLLTTPTVTFPPDLRRLAPFGYYIPEEVELLPSLREIMVNLLEHHLAVLPRLQT